MLPQKYMGAVMFGCGVSGLVLNVLRAICLVALPPSSDPGSNTNYISTLIYFSIAAVMVIACAIGYVVF